jgi:uncharacterized protein YcfJ
MSKLLPKLALAACLLAPGLVFAEEGGAAAGAVAGGAAGAAVGGPVGAAAGAGVGAVVGGAASGPEHHDVVVERPAETTGTVVEPCSSKTVKEKNSMGESRTTSSTNCP